MNMRTVYDHDRERRVTGTDFLERRLEINRGYSSANFDQWLLQRLEVAQGEDLLDVGCGSGAQTVPFSQLVGDRGSVSATDISEDSIALLRTRLGTNANVQLHVADMATLEKTIADVFKVKRYDMAHSSYALYYSPSRLDVLDVMRNSLKQRGRCAVFSPNAPHGLVELASRFATIPNEVSDCLTFGPLVLAPYFKANFARFDVHHFKNVVTVPDANLLIDFYRQTTYHDAAAEDAMREIVNQEISRTGSFKYEKNGYLIVGYTHGE